MSKLSCIGIPEFSPSTAGLAAHLQPALCGPPASALLRLPAAPSFHKAPIADAGNCFALKVGFCFSSVFVFFLTIDAGLNSKKSPEGFNHQ